jgi:dTDP-4-dehydrorhamnose reductase
MTIAVTGSSGQLGGELCRQLGDEAARLDLPAFNLTDAAGVAAALARLRPEAVINCAAYTQVDRAEQEPEAAWAVNAAAVGVLVRACGELDCPLVQISTDYVFGGTSVGRPWREDDPTAPQGVYARSKLAGEQAAAQHARHWVVRTCGLYARPNDRGATHFVRTMLRLGREGKPLRVVRDQHCTPSYVPHVARAVLFLAGRADGGPAPWGVYHVTNGGATTWFDFACAVFRHAGMDVRVEPITTAEYAAAAPRPAYSVLDTARYHRLGGPTMPSWEAALAEFFAEREGDDR